MTTTSYDNVFGEEVSLPTHKFDRNSNVWRKYTAKLCKENLQDDCNRKLEVGIHPKTLQMINQDHKMEKCRNIKIFFQGKFQAQNEAFCKYRENQKGEMIFLNMNWEKQGNAK